VWRGQELRRGMPAERNERGRTRRRRMWDRDGDETTVIAHEHIAILVCLTARQAPPIVPLLSFTPVPTDIPVPTFPEPPWDRLTA